MGIFLDKHNDLRSGWRMLLFLIVSTFSGIVLIVPDWGLFGWSDIVGLILLTASVLLGTFVMTRFINRKPFGAIGLFFHPAAPREFGMGCLLGFLMMSGVFIVELTLGYVGLTWRGVSPDTGLALLGASLALFALSAFFEEILFRGYFFQTLIQAATFVPATLVMAVLFALAHGRNPEAGLFGLINVGLAGVWLSIAYMKTRSLWLPLGLHLAWNFSQTTIFSFPTSGVSFEGRQLFLLTQSGPAWLTGGRFGPEGGVLATLSLIGCTWYLLKSRVVRVPEGMITLDSVEDLLPPREPEGRG